MANAYTNATSNAISSVLTKEKQFFYNSTNTNSTVVDEAVELMNQKELNIKVGPNSTNIGYTIPIGQAYHVTNAFFSTSVVCGSAAANTVLIAVTTNGASVVSFNSEALAANVAAGAIVPLTVTSTNSYLDSAETLLITTTCDEAADGSGIITIRMRPVTHGK